MAEKFDIYNFLFEGMLREQDEEVDPQFNNQMGADPSQQGQAPAPQTDTQTPPPTQAEAEPTPQQAQQAVKTPFTKLIGETIKGIEFQPTQNGGSIVIKTDSPLPFIISWEGDSVTLKNQGITKLK